MFIFSFRGLGFLVPAAMIAPNLACYLMLSISPEFELRKSLIICGFVFVTSPIFTYGVGKILNRNGVKHAFGEIRFEHWGFVQFAVATLIVGLITLNASMENLESALPLGSWLRDKIFLIYLAVLLISPFWLFIYLKKKMRKMNPDLTNT